MVPGFTTASHGFGFRVDRTLDSFDFWNSVFTSGDVTAPSQGRLSHFLTQAARQRSSLMQMTHARPKTADLDDVFIVGVFRNDMTKWVRRYAWHPDWQSHADCILKMADKELASNWHYGMSHCATDMQDNLEGETMAHMSNLVTEASFSFKLLISKSPLTSIAVDPFFKSSQDSLVAIALTLCSQDEPVECTQWSILEYQDTCEFFDLVLSSVWSVATDRCTLRRWMGIHNTLWPRRHLR